jgi:flavin reductase (DIM6/NTAB) family NADH-FMN oxidoreductase RutF
MVDQGMDHSTAIRQFPYGLYVVGSSRNGHPLLILVNWLTQVSFAPPLIAVSIELNSKMHQFISTSGYFTVNVLPAGHTELARAFLKNQDVVSGGLIGGREFTATRHGAPVIAEASASLECHVKHSYEAGDHTLFVGEVIWSVVNIETTGMTLKESGLSYRRKTK